MRCRSRRRVPHLALDTVASVGETVADMRRRADAFGRKLTYGLRAYMIVRETEAEARAAADRPAEGARR